MRQAAARGSDIHFEWFDTAPAIAPVLNQGGLRLQKVPVQHRLQLLFSSMTYCAQLGISVIHKARDTFEAVVNVTAGMVPEGSATMMNTRNFAPARAMSGEPKDLVNLNCRIFGQLGLTCGGITDSARTKVLPLMARGFPLKTPSKPVSVTGDAGLRAKVNGKAVDELYGHSRPQYSISRRNRSSTSR